MMNLREIKAMLKRDFDIKYISDLEKVELIENTSESCTFGIVKIELQVSYKRYVLGTFRVADMCGKMHKKGVREYKRYFDKIANWFVDGQEVNVDIFLNEEYQYTQKVKEVEFMTFHVEQSQEEETQENVPCGTIKEETKGEENDMKKMTKIVNYINNNGYELKQLDEGWYSTCEDDNSVFLEFHIQKLNLEVIIEKIDYNYKVKIFHNKNNDVYEFGGFICRTQNEILKGLNEIIDEEEQSQKEVVPCEQPQQKIMSHDEYVKYTKPYSKYISDMMVYYKEQYQKDIMDKYEFFKNLMSIMFESEHAIFSNTYEEKKDYFKGYLENLKNEYQSFMINNDNQDYNNHKKAYDYNAKIMGCKGLLNEIMGCCRGF